MVNKGNAAMVQVLVCWGSLPAALATWEDFDVVRTRFPAALAWGQAPILWGGGPVAAVGNGAAALLSNDSE